MEKEKNVELYNAIVAALEGSDKPLSMKEIAEASGFDVKPGHLTSAIKQGLIIKAGDEEYVRPGIRKVGSYVLGEYDGELSEKEAATVEIAKGFAGSFTNTMLNEAAGHKIVIGSLVKKGIFVKDGEVEVPTTSKAKRALYTVNR